MAKNGTRRRPGKKGVRRRAKKQQEQGRKPPEQLSLPEVPRPDSGIPAEPDGQEVQKRRKTP